MNEYDKQAYLKRINYQGIISNSLECLTSIHHAQHKTIPFENFDICLNQPIDLTPEAIIEKLVKNKRGGYCFELNGLFLMALKSFGFDARAVLGRVHITGEPTGRGHQVSLVNINGANWLVDTGFGSGTPPMPIPMILNQPISFGERTFQLIKTERYGFMLQNKHEDDWRDMYSFDLAHVCEGDIAYGNHYTSTNLNSHFVTSRVAALPIKNGMITLHNHNLKKVINGKEKIIVLEENQSYIEQINDNFGIELNVKYEDLKPIIY